MEAVAHGVVDGLFATLVDHEGQPACALVRLYVTARLDALEPRLQGLARNVPGLGLGVDTRCLTLLGTAGLLPAWNDRRTSERHQVIPLSDEELVTRLPMVAGLLGGLGIEPASVVRPDPADNQARAGRRYDLFFVPEAANSPSVPDAGFVERYGIRSTLGFGGVLPSGELFAVLLFTRVALTQAVADLLRTLALTVQALVMPHTYRVFERAAADPG